MLGIFILLIIAMLLVVKFCKKTLKIVLSIIIVLISLYCIIISVDRIEYIALENLYLLQLS